ncbi:hypothetical protein GCM10023187_14800 [Nibrella viscosa]|uniref:DUF4397 domain-containing protein n=1 Tax=Nibrella viscosa TaxID=1084524 RepID=A0ABP8K5U6_9BACT
MNSVYSLPGRLVNGLYFPVFVAWRLLLLSCVGLLLGYGCAAQTPVNYVDPANPSRGYWRLHADRHARSSVIRLYRGADELIYQETIPGQYLRLTARTTSQINTMLSLVVAHKLVLSDFKEYDFPSGSADPMATEAVPTAVPAEINRDYAAVEVVAHLIKPTGKLLVRCDNPARRRLDIYLRNQSGHNVYAESMNLDKYSRRIDVSALKAGQYSLHIISPDKTFEYTRQVIIGLRDFLEMK